jgi:hypothetical protein
VEVGRIAEGSMANSVFRPNHETKEVRTCPECGAVVEGNRCWLCHRSLTADQAGVAQATAPYERQQASQSTFGLSTLFLVITVIAVCLGVFVAAPGLGILLAVIAVPAFVRTSAATSAQEQSAGRPVDVPDKVGLFLGSIGIMLLIGLAGFGAFFAACWASCAALSVTGAFRRGGGNSGLLLVNLFAGGIALALVGWLLWKTWPHRPGRRR